MMGEKQEGRITTPAGRRIRLLQQRFMPVAVWCSALAVVLVMAQRGTMYIDAVGIVEVREAMVAPLEDGTIQTMMVGLFDEVKAGDIVAVMDDSLVKSELKVAEAELSQIRAQVTAERSRLQLAAVERQLDVQRKFVLDQEQAELDYLDRAIQQAINKVGSERLSIQLERQKLLLEKDITDKATYDETRLLHEAIKTELKENQEALALATQRVEEARRRRESYEQQSADVEVPHLIEPLIESVRVQEARIDEISDRRQHLLVRAPLSGTVCHVFQRIARTGETVMAGVPLLSITASQSKRVVAYVDERAARDMEVGMPVEVSTRDYPRKVVTTQLLKVGAKIEEFPLRLRRNPVFSQWGVAALVGDVPADVFLPGEFVNLRFVRAHKPRMLRTES